MSEQDTAQKHTVRVILTVLSGTFAAILSLVLSNWSFSITTGRAADLSSPLFLLMSAPLSLVMAFFFGIVTWFKSPKLSQSNQLLLGGFILFGVCLLLVGITH